MRWYQLRPTFEIGIIDSRESAMEKLQREYLRLASPEKFFLHGEYGELHLPPAEHRVWSPHLSFYVSETAEHGLIRGRFAPRVEVWTLVWIVYLAMAFTIFFGLMLAYSQWMLSEPMWGAWVATASLAVFVCLLGAAHVGQQWSADQMRTLRGELENILQSAEIRAASDQIADEAGSEN